jgi:hypothetical protein
MTTREYLPCIGWPVYDLRRRKFGICIDVMPATGAFLVHVEGDRFPRYGTPDDVEYEYPKFYNDDALKWSGENDPNAIFYVKHVHLHVPDSVWEYTIAQSGIKGFDRLTIRGENDLFLLKRHVSKV